jgi:hypothetical protein
MSSAAHVYGRKILGAEAFTATDAEKWQGWPGNIKDLGDWAFCEGINRFVFHRYALQPWTDVRPGVSMGPWGLHYERTQTWWEMSRAWHEYLARCQFLLQQGRFVADLCFLAPENSPQRFRSPVKEGYDRPGYNFDACPPEVVLTRMSVKNGRLTLPDGMSYRWLVLPQVESMTPRLLSKIKELVAAGATVVGAPPSRSPSLSGYPKCDEEVKQLAAELWGNGAPPAEITAHSYGKGRIFWGGEFSPQPATPEKATKPLGAAKWVWRQEGNPAVAVPPGKRFLRRVFTLDEGASVVSATLAMTVDNSFECWVNGKRAGSGDDFTHIYQMRVASMLKPGTNMIAVAAVNGGEAPNPAGLIGLLRVDYGGGRVIEVPSDGQWEAAESVGADWTTSVAAAESWAPAMVLGPLGMAPWGELGGDLAAKDPIPDVKVLCRMLEGEGVAADFACQGRAGDQPLRYIHKVIDGTDLYFVANKNPQTEEAICAFRVKGRRPELWWPDTGRIERPAAYDQSYYAVVSSSDAAAVGGRPALYRKDDSGDVTLVPVRLGPFGSVFVMFRPGAPVERDRIVSAVRVPRADTVERLLEARWQYPARLAAWQTTGPLPATVPLELTRDDAGRLVALAAQPGSYRLETARGRTLTFDVPADVLPQPRPFEITGPWELRFAPGWGAPERVTLDKLISWSEHADPGVKYFSGTCTYIKQFDLPDGFTGRDRRLFLDLGKVAVMAHVTLNGKDLGILWKTPYRVDMTDAVRPGSNALEIQVVNLWINRQIGDEQLPEDSDRNANGTLKSWPKWLEAGQRSPAGRFTFTSWRLWKKDDPLVESGLLGPVTIDVVQRVAVK